MTREEHIAKAEGLLASGYVKDLPRAQVHATLALACPPETPEPVAKPKRLPWWSLGWLR